MRADLKRFWGIISGKQQEKPRPRLRSTSLPRITPSGLIGFSYEYETEKGRKCTPLWYDYDLGKKSNTFPRRTKLKKRSSVSGRDRSASVTVESTNTEELSRTFPRRGSASPRHFKVDIDKTINEEEILDMKELKTALISIDEGNNKEKIKKAMTTVLCSTDL